MNEVASGIYNGFVVHERMRPRRHRFRYRVFTLLLDLDELEALSKRHWLLGYNRRAFFSIMDRDHGELRGGGEPESIRVWIQGELNSAGLGEYGKRVMMLCYPRILGYVFNPLTVYFCFGNEGELGAVVYEVHNTFGERHRYILPVLQQDTAVIKQSCNKEFYVSPFVPMACRYDFHVLAPAEDVRIVIREEDDVGLLLVAAFVGRHSALSDSRLLKAAFRYPLMTVKVLVAIRFEAIRLFLKGITVIPRRRSQQETPAANRQP